ncbi:hypothetical protein AAZV13_13G227700 [Glycine max]
MEGFGQAFVVSEEHQLDWADLFFMTTLPKHLRMPHLFPKLTLLFRLSSLFFFFFSSLSLSFLSKCNH